MEPIPVIDIFAGPGGLGEGFSSLDAGGTFDVRLSIEKDTYAHRTLELRAFFREFTGNPPEEYYQYLAGERSRVDLFKLYPRQAAAAEKVAWRATLGTKSCTREKLAARIGVALGAARRNWVLIGGPPCQAYSLVGRSRIRGASVKKYERDRRHHLYRHYLRILAYHQPAVFVMENVKGLLSAQLKEQRIIKHILRDLKNPSQFADGQELRCEHPVRYRLYSVVTARMPNSEDLPPTAFVVRAEKYGVPQARHRVILLGVRSDIETVPGTLTPHGRPVTINRAIKDLPPLRSGLSKEPDDTAAWEAVVRSAGKAEWLAETSVDSELRTAIRKAARKVRTGLTRGKEFLPGSPKPTIPGLADPRLKGFCNHATRAHIRGDLHRYLFAAVYGSTKRRSPGLEVFPHQLLPDHDNVREALLEGKFNDRFRVQMAGRPSTTVTCHISKDGHYFIHYDPTQCRSLTVREAARLQTFPDNYFFEGPRTEQYKQVGNAVPPLLARQIARIVAEVLA